MRMRRSSRQCVMSASQASCSFWVHGLEPPSHAPFMVKHYGEGICCFCGANFVSWATPRQGDSASKRKLKKRKDLMVIRPRSQVFEADFDPEAYYYLKAFNAIASTGSAHPGIKKYGSHETRPDGRSMTAIMNRC